LDNYSFSTSIKYSIIKKYIIYLDYFKIRILKISRFLISRFLISRFLISRFLISRFLISLFLIILFISYKSIDREIFNKYYSLFLAKYKI